MTIKKTTLKFVFKLKTAPVIDSSWPKTILISVTECLERFCQFFKRRFCEESFYNNLYNYHRLAWLFSILLNCDVRFHFLFTTKYFFSTLHVPFQNVILVNWYIFRRFYKAWSFVYLTLFAFFSRCYSLSADEDRTTRKRAYTALITDLILHRVDVLWEESVRTPKYLFWLVQIWNRNKEVWKWTEKGIKLTMSKRNCNMQEQYLSNAVIF